MIIDTITVTDFQQNCRLIVDENSNKAAVIDPGGDIPAIIELVKSRGVQVESIFLTHAHLDHAGGTEDLEVALAEEDIKIQLYAHRINDVRIRIEDHAGMYGFPEGYFKNTREPDVYIDDNDEFSVGDIKFKALFTPGHAPDHLALYFETADETPVLIAGDTLFQGSIGRTDLPGGDHDTLISSIRNKLYSLPDETIVKPGHGPDTTIGREKISNPFVQA